MDRETFIDTLRRALYGKIDDRSLAEHIQYYEHYLSQEIASGRSEQEVLDELGDPRLIARTILETASARSTYTEYTVSEEVGDEQEPEYRVHSFAGWKATAVMVGVIFAVLLLLVLIFQVVVAILPLLLVFGIIFWVMRKLWN